MARLLWTIWALMLNSFGLSIFPTCFAHVLEDDYGQPLIASPSISTFLFATSVYVIIVSSTLFPESFRKPNSVFLCLYEFLVTAFLLEFTIAYLWAPINVLVVHTLPMNLSYILYRSGLINTAGTLIYKIKPYMTIVTNGMATMIFFVTLYVTKIIDFEEPTDKGVTYFLSRLERKLWQRIRSELPEVKGNKENKCRCNIRRKDRNNNHAHNKKS